MSVDVDDVREVENTNPDDQDAAEMSALERKHYERIQDLEKHCETLEEDFEEKNAAAKLAKKLLESAVEQLRAVIRKGPDTQGELPFDEVDSEWEQTPIGEALDLTDKQLEKLEDAGVKTVGEFERLRAGTVEYPNGLRDIKGVGEALIDKWEEQILDFLKEHSASEQNSDLVDDVASEFGALVQ